MKQMKQKIRDKGGGVGVVVVFPLLLLVVAGYLITIVNPAYAINWAFVKLLSLVVLLGMASRQDLKENMVDNKYCLLLFLVGLINVSLDSVIALAVCGGVFLLVAMFTHLGGADVKITAATAFVLGTLPTLIALMIGLSLSILVESGISIKQKQNILTRHYPLVPYISIGCVLVVIMKGVFA